MRNLFFLLVAFALLFGCTQDSVPAQDGLDSDLGDEPVGDLPVDDVVDDLLGDELEGDLPVDDVVDDLLGDELEGDLPVSDDSGLFDCGVSESLADAYPDYDLVFEEDSALVCLGENFLNDCVESRAVFSTFNAGSLDVELRKGSGDECVFYLRYGEEDQIPLDAQKQYAGKDISCPFVLSDFEALNTTGESLDSLPGNLMITMYVLAGFEALNPDSVCSGSLFE
jgi:hypothetical protein